jgi:hypothetical protein
VMSYYLRGLERRGAAAPSLIEQAMTTISMWSILHGASVMNLVEIMLRAGLSSQVLRFPHRVMRGCRDPLVTRIQMQGLMTVMC